MKHSLMNAFNAAMAALLNAAGFMRATYPNWEREPRKERGSATGKRYPANGARECARRRRHAERIAAKRAREAA